MKSRSLLRIILILIATSSAALASTPDLQSELNRLYEDRIFRLRRADAATLIVFNSEGTRVSQLVPGRWSEDVQFKCVDVLVQEGEIEFIGMRLFLSWEPKKRTFVAMNTSRMMRIKLQIAAPITSGEVAEFTSKIFLPAVEPIASSAPDYWEHCVKGIVKKGKCYLPRSKASAKVLADRPLAVLTASDRGVTPPQVLIDPPPSYTEIARQSGLEGTVILACVVGADGSVTDTRIVKPLGLGLDDMAVEVVNGWKFNPATKDGVPVAVRVNVEANFRLY